MRPDADLGAWLEADLLEFLPPLPRELLRVNEVTNRPPSVYTAQEKTKGAHLAPEARQKRSASSAFEHVIAERTDYSRKLKNSEELFWTTWLAAPKSKKGPAPSSSPRVSYHTSHRSTRS